MTGRGLGPSRAGMKHGSAATTIFPLTGTQTKTSRRRASCSGALDPRLDEPRETHESPARPRHETAVERGCVRSGAHGRVRLPSGHGY